MITANFVAQIEGTVSLPIVGAATSLDAFNSILIIVGVITALSFFFFTWEHTGALGISTRIGRYFLMATFGSFYGGTVMARMSLFIGRLRFLYETTYPDTDPWFWAWYLIPIAFLCIAAVAWYEYTRPSPPEAAPAKAKTKTSKT